jgi:hypothetical protein
VGTISASSSFCGTILHAATVTRVLAVSGRRSRDSTPYFSGDASRRGSQRAACCIGERRTLVKAKICDLMHVWSNVHRTAGDRSTVGPGGLCIVLLPKPAHVFMHRRSDTARQTDAGTFVARRLLPTFPSASHLSRSWKCPREVTPGAESIVIRYIQ